MKTVLKKVTLVVLPLVAFLLIAPTSALAKKRHRHCDRDHYSRYDNDYHSRYGRYRNDRYYYDRYYGDDYYRRPSRYRSRYYDPYYGSPYGNPSSYYPSTGALPWLDLLFPRY